jgi:hypothetical protein
MLRVTRLHLRTTLPPFDKLRKNQAFDKLAMKAQSFDYTQSRGAVNII